MPTKCFFLEPTDQEQFSLRRWNKYTGQPVCGPSTAHRASRRIDLAELKDKIAGFDGSGRQLTAETAAAFDWPTVCEDCGYQFTAEDEFYIDNKDLYRSSDTGELTTIQDAPPGAMWYADWMLHGDNPIYRGPDGHCLVVKLPNGFTWMVDGDASNCTDPEDFRRGGHKCWVRHGTPPNIHVDKNGKTCGAGAGSIQGGNYHGFLHHGELTDG